MRHIKHKATILGLAAVLLAVCALPGAAAVAADDNAAPSWGSQLIERLLDSVAGWFGVEDEGDTADDGGIVLEGGDLDDPTSNSSECPPANPNCEGGPDWDPNG